MNTILIEKKTAEICLLKINRPDCLNALNRIALNELKDFLENGALNQSFKGIILTGGPKAFIAGADIKEMSQLSQAEMLSFCELGQQVANLLSNSPFVTIAAVNGYALGAGTEMALACDLVYASDNAIFGLPEITLGLIPGFGGTQRLTRTIGSHLAKELILSGRTFTAQEAKNLGLVNKVVPQSSLLEEAFQAVQEIIKYPPEALRQAKMVINSCTEVSMGTGLALERNMCAACQSTPEAQQALANFVNKAKK